MSYSDEFPPAEWPDVTNVAALLERGFIDQSWHNDVCPHFAIQQPGGDDALSVWIDPPEWHGGAYTYVVTTGGCDDHPRHEWYSGESFRNALTVVESALEYKMLADDMRIISDCGNFIYCKTTPEHALDIAQNRIINADGDHDENRGLFACLAVCDIGDDDAISTLFSAAEIFEDLATVNAVPRDADGAIVDDPAAAYAAMVSDAEAEKTAVVFLRHVQQYLNKADWQACIAKQRELIAEGKGSFSAPDDYCDANIMMESAIAAVRGNCYVTDAETKPHQAAKDLALWNAAYPIALAKLALLGERS